MKILDLTVNFMVNAYIQNINSITEVKPKIAESEVLAAAVCGHNPNTVLTSHTSSNRCPCQNGLLFSLFFLTTSLGRYALKSLIA